MFISFWNELKLTSATKVIYNEKMIKKCNFSEAKNYKWLPIISSWIKYLVSLKYLLRYFPNFLSTFSSLSFLYYILNYYLVCHLPLVSVSVYVVVDLPKSFSVVFFAVTVKFFQINTSRWPYSFCSCISTPVPSWSFHVSLYIYLSLTDYRFIHSLTDNHTDLSV